jgi:hypothetical protein
MLFCTTLSVSGTFPDAGPDVRSWVLTASTNLAIRDIAPDVHSVHADDDFVYVESAGLSLHSFGSLEANQYDPPLGPRRFTFRIPRHPRQAKGLHASTPLGVVGAFVTGVPIYNPIGTASYRDQNIWHQDAVAASAAGVSQLVEALKANAGRHSPIIGFALDGFPIYGPFGWDAAGNIRRMTSSYRLRRIVRRTVLPDGTTLTPGQEGPNVGPAFPLGTFAEDYEFVRGSGTLDEYNGRFTRTPEYPDGTYAYFLTTWPYLVGPKYAGTPEFTERISDLPAKLLTTDPIANKPTELTLSFNDPNGRPIRFLERVHEQPIHLILVSKDLAEFAHIHPQPAPGDVFTVTHTFAHGGTYTAYADYTAPGAPPAIAKFDIEVAGPVNKHQPLEAETDAAEIKQTKTASGVQIQFNAPARIKAGEDIPLSFSLNVQDLEPWLGSWAHIMMVSRDRQTFIHAHPTEGPNAESNPLQHVHIAPVSGPSPATIRTVTGFREPGLYKLWLQFQRQGRIITVPWTIQVEPSDKRAPQVNTPTATASVIVSSKGFEPARLTIPANQKTQVAFTRIDAQNCASEVVFPQLGIRKPLPPGQTVPVHLPPTSSGELRFACGMGMYKGALLVQ